MICRSEGDAMGRITAGILGPLKFDKSLSQGTIEQLRNLVTGGVDNVFQLAGPAGRTVLRTVLAVSAPLGPLGLQCFTQSRMRRAKRPWRRQSPRYRATFRNPRPDLRT